MSRAARDLARFREQEVPLISGVLSGGISQQPSMSRFGNQLTDGINTDFHPFDGASKRAGTQWRAVVGTSTLSSMTAAGSYQTHTIDRDDREQYIVVRGLVGANMRLRVFERLSNGSFLEATVTYAGASQTYLNTATSPTNLQLKTEGDTTFVYSTNKAVAMLASPTYTLTATWDDADTMVAQTPAVNTYHRARADGVDLAAGYYQYTPGADGRTFATFSARIWPYTDWGKLRGDWDDASNSPSTLRIGFRRLNLALTGVTATNIGSGEWELTKVGGFAGVTFETNDMVRITAGTGNTYPSGSTSGWVTYIRNKIGALNDTIVVRALAAGGSPAYAVGQSVAMVNATANIAIDGVGREYELSVDIAGDIAAARINDMTDIADRLQQEFRALGGDDVLVAWVPSLNGNGAFLITGPWKGNDATIYAPQTPIGGTSSGDLTVDDRPFSKTALEHTITAGTGGTLGTGGVRVAIADRWTKVYAPDQPRYRPDSTSMPHRMVRTGYTGDGTTPATFTVEAITWNAREDGDEETNDIPEPFKTGQKVTALTVFKNRLGLAMGSNVCWTKAGDLYNFYLTKEGVVADDDRITLTLAASQAPTPYAMLAYRDKVLVLTQPEQVFEIGGNAFTPTQATVNLGPVFPSLPHQPVLAGPFAYMMGNPLSGVTGGVRQTASVWRYAYDEASAASIGDNVADHVPNLVEAFSDRMVSLPGEGWLGILPRNSSLFYVLRTYFSGSRELMRAWSIYQLDTGVRIVDMVNLRNEVILLCERVTRDVNQNITSSSGEYVFESLRIQPDAVVQASALATTPLPLRLDRRTTLTGTFDGTNTNYTIPFTDSTLTKVITPDGVLRDLVRPSGTSARVAGNYAGTATLGRPYNWVLQLSEQFIRYDNGVSSLPARPIITAMRMRVRRSGDMQVEMVRANDSVIQAFSPTNGFLAGEATWRVSPVGLPGSSTIYISSGSHYPVTLQAIEFISRAASQHEGSRQ